MPPLSLQDSKTKIYRDLQLLFQMIPRLMSFNKLGNEIFVILEEIAKFISKDN